MYVQRPRDERMGEKGDGREDERAAVVVLGRTLRTDPKTFGMDDMRFFQHFLCEAYPSLPIDGWPVWQLVSQMSHKVSCLFFFFFPLPFAQNKTQLINSAQCSISV